MSAHKVDEIVDAAVAERLATAMVQAYSTLDGQSEIFTDDVLFDVNVPQWRFQIQGAESFTGWLREHTDVGYRLQARRVTPTTSGFVVELEGRYEHHGEHLYFRNLLLCEVRDERISEVIFYCTGDWDEKTCALQAAEVTLIRP